MKVNTLKELVDTLYSNLTTEDKEYIRNHTKQEIHGVTHHFYGRGIRNEFGLWHDESADLREDIWNSLSEEKKQFYHDWWHGDYQGRTMHADDASAEILDALIARVTSSL